MSAGKWKTVALGEVAKIVSGATPKTDKSEFWGGNIPWVTPADLSNHQGINFGGSCKKLTEKGYKSCSATMLPIGSILFSSRAPIGHSAVTTFPVCTNQGFKNLIPNDKLDPVFGFFTLKYLTPQIISLGRGATFAEVTKEIMEEIEIPLPDLPTQKRLSALLTRADRLRRLHRFALARCEEMLETAFLEKFASEDFPTTSVEALTTGKGSMRTGPFGSQLLVSEFVESGIAVLGIDNAVQNRFAWDQRRFITEAKYRDLKRYTVKPRDILITLMGTCGRCAVVPDNIPTAINTKHLCCVTIDQQKCLPLYLQGAFLFHPAVRHQLGVAKKGAIMDGLNMEIISNLEIPVPPLPLQKQFAHLAQHHERLRRQHTSALQHSTHLFQTLLHQTFS